MTLTLDVSDAAARFRTLSGVGDNGVRYAAGRNQPGKCTRWTWLALGKDGQGFQNSTPLPSAVAAWHNAPAEHRHPLTEKPFAGAVLVFGPTSGPRWAGDENYPYGDVTVLDGSGYGSGDWQDWGMSATDASGVGVISRVTGATRYVQTGRRPVLGWLSSYGGAVLVSGATSAAAGSTTPLPAASTSAHQEDTMLAIRNDKNGALLGIGVGIVRHCPSQRQFDLIVKATPGNKAQHTDEATLAQILVAHGIPAAAVDPNWIVKNADKGSGADGHTWSAVGSLRTALGK
ncbi:hypothetical protein ACTJKO_07585 [Curtobacterium sp. 22159]|uniref:hypothetical protein n=1 Tax=Curtobacterium sp. 22159 TaxID=3453882 RepID=UPI003F85E763